MRTPSGIRQGPSSTVCAVTLPAAITGGRRRRDSLMAASVNADSPTSASPRILATAPGRCRIRSKAQASAVAVVSLPATISVTSSSRISSSVSELPSSNSASISIVRTSVATSPAGDLLAVLADLLVEEPVETPPAAQEQRPRGSGPRSRGTQSPTAQRDIIAIRPLRGVGKRLACALGR